MNRRPLTTIGLLLVAFVAACGSDGADGGPAGGTTADGDGGASIVTDGPGAGLEGTTVTLVAYESFPVEGTPINDALDEFTADTGIEVDILIAGDTGTMLAKAALTAGNPEGDVMWGVDNTFLSRAIDADVFEPYRAAGADALPAALTALVPNGEATPVDFGDVCVNYDIGWFDERGIDPPATFDDLLDPAYDGLLVVENPATSSPGLAFLLATIDEYGPEGWQAYWSGLVDNGVEVVDGWTQAYVERFSWSGGPRPLVVSYASSPPFEVLYADPPRDDAPTGVLESTCFRQVEFAGVLRGTDHPDAARRLIDFLLTERFQRELAVNLFVFPVDPDTELPPVFTEFAVVPERPRSLDPALIEANRATWVDEWTTLVLG